MSTLFFRKFALCIFFVIIVPWYKITCLIAQSDVDLPDIPIISTITHTQSENSVFISPVDPNIVLNANNTTEIPPVFPFAVSGLVSDNGGSSWSNTPLVLNNSLVDPAVAIGQNGRLYVGYIDVSTGPSISYSDDGGITWIERQVAPGIGRRQ